MTAEERAAFIGHIIAAPDDDTARLVYADRVQDDGDDAGARRVRGGVRCYCLASHLPFAFACSHCNALGFVERCQHAGCRQEGHPCFQPYDPEAPEAQPIDYFCGAHAGHHGYCRACGAFWGGISSFEASGICDTCRDEREADAREESDYEDGLFYGDDYET